MILHHTIDNCRVQSTQNYIPGLQKAHKRSERLDGVKPTPKRDRPGQPRKYKKMFRVTPMETMIRQRPAQNGSGKGKGQPGGRGLNRNTKPCKSGPGKSQGGGKGKGKSR